MSYHRLCDWFEQGQYWTTPKQELEPIVAAKLKELKRDAQERGWDDIS